MIISDGYNGTPTGFENICEDDEGYTKWCTSMLKQMLLKVAASTQSCKALPFTLLYPPVKIAAN